MKKTVGTSDRVLRGVLAVGAVIGAGVVGFTSGWGVVLLIVAAVMAVTGASGYCPAYSILHVNTLSRGKADDAGARGDGVVHAH